MKISIRKSGLVVASASALVTFANVQAGLFDGLFKKKPVAKQCMPNEDCSFGYNATTWQPWDTCHLTEPCEPRQSSGHRYESTPYTTPVEVWPSQPPAINGPSGDQFDTGQPLVLPRPGVQPGIDPGTDHVPVPNGAHSIPNNSNLLIPANPNPPIIGPSVPGNSIQQPLVHPPTSQPVPTPSAQPLPTQPMPLPSRTINPPRILGPQRSPAPSSLPPIGRDASHAAPVDSINLPLPTTSPIPGLPMPNQSPSGQSYPNQNQIPVTPMPSRVPMVPPADSNARYAIPRQVTPAGVVQPTAVWQQDSSGNWRVMPGYYSPQTATTPQQQFRVSDSEVEFLPPPR